MKKITAFMLFLGLAAGILSCRGNAFGVKEDEAIKQFFQWVNQGRYGMAMDLLDEKSFFPDSQAKQNWEEILKSFQEVNIERIEPANPEKWTGDYQIYKVSLLVKLKPDAPGLKLPNNDWKDGETNRWIGVTKAKFRIWKITRFATNP